MITRWIPLRNAIAFVARHHRHSPKVRGGIIALGCWDAAGTLVGVAILGRGARLDPPDLVVITRVATNGHRNACSKLYAKAHRLAQALGFTKVKTFTKDGESGASLRAVGAIDAGTTVGGSWCRQNRIRETSDTNPKRRWLLKEQ